MKGFRLIYSTCMSHQAQMQKPIEKRSAAMLEYLRIIRRIKNNGKVYR